MRGNNTFKRTEMARAVLAMRDANVDIESIEVDRHGTIVIRPRPFKTEGETSSEAA
jgi:hypothetical protein